MTSITTDISGQPFYCSDLNGGETIVIDFCDDTGSEFKLTLEREAAIDLLETLASSMNYSVEEFVVEEEEVVQAPQ